MARRTKKVREIRLVGQAHREAEDRLRQAYHRLWQVSWPPEENKERCADGKENSLVCAGVDGAPRTGRDDRESGR